MMVIAKGQRVGSAAARSILTETPSRPSPATRSAARNSLPETISGPAGK
jgi:hypothetical protein